MSERLHVIIVFRFKLCLWLSIVFFMIVLVNNFALYTIHWCGHLPLKGQLLLILQLHGLCILSCSLLKIFKWWCLIKFSITDLSWMNKEIKKLIHEKRNILNCFHWNNNDKQLLDRLNDLQTQLNFLMEISEGKYYSQITSKLSDTGKGSKSYWSILESFLTGKKFHLFQHYLKTVNALQISRKKQNYSIHFLQTGAP